MRRGARQTPDHVRARSECEAAKQEREEREMKRSSDLECVPNEPSGAASCYSPTAYEAFARQLAKDEVRGVGASIRDEEILRLVCLEKVRRDGPLGGFNQGFIANFLANVDASWADGRVAFFDEGLGYGWNLRVTEEHPVLILERVLANPGAAWLFAFSRMSARLPGYDCEIHDDYTVCRYNADAPGLSASERMLWEQSAADLCRAHGLTGGFAIAWGNHE